MQREGRRTQAERNVSEEHRYTGWPDGYIRRTLESPRFIPLFYLFVLLKYFAIFSNLRTTEREIYIYIIVIVIMIESGSNLILRFDSDLFFHSEERRGGVLI